MQFKKSLKYTRKDVGQICLPKTARLAGGDWDAGYDRVGNNLVNTLNIIKQRVLS